MHDAAFQTRFDLVRSVLLRASAHANLVAPDVLEI
jgi:hypothetical protein